jgi:hypothetical protein
MLEIKSRAGRTLRILTLTSEQALHACKHRRAGAEHLIIADATVTFDGNHLALFTGNGSPLKLHVMPSMNLAGAGLQSTGTEGEFQVYSVTPPASEVQRPVVTNVGKNEWRIETGVPPKRSRLRIKYTGDVAGLYMGDRLVYDDFYNGEVFEVSLDRLAAELRCEPLVLKISPLEETKRVYLDVPRPEGDPVLESVSITVENRIELRMD